MSLKFASFEKIKELYLVKAEAVAAEDNKTLNRLQKSYPELFQAHFLLDFLKEILIRNGLVNKKNLN